MTIKSKKLEALVVFYNQFKRDFLNAQLHCPFGKDSLSDYELHDTFAGDYCTELCGKFWPELPTNFLDSTTCPCHAYGCEIAFAMLKRLLAQYGLLGKEEKE